MFVGSTLGQIWQAANAQGYGAEGHTAIYAFLEELAQEGVVMGRESSTEARTGPGPALAGGVSGRSWFEALGEAVAADAEMAVIGRWCTLDLALVADEEMVLLRLREGHLRGSSNPGISYSWSVTTRHEKGLADLLAAGASSLLQRPARHERPRPVVLHRGRPCGVRATSAHLEQVVPPRAADG